jgi:hypothetical protein
VDQKVARTPRPGSPWRRYIRAAHARVAKPVDAGDLKSPGRKAMQVRILLRALELTVAISRDG